MKKLLVFIMLVCFGCSSNENDFEGKYKSIPHFEKFKRLHKNHWNMDLQSKVNVGKRSKQIIDYKVNGQVSITITIDDNEEQFGEEGNLRWKMENDSLFVYKVIDGKEVTINRFLASKTGSGYFLTGQETDFTLIRIK